MLRGGISREVKCFCCQYQSFIWGTGLVCGLWGSSGVTKSPQNLTRCGWCDRFVYKFRCERGDPECEQGGMTGVQHWIDMATEASKIENICIMNWESVPPSVKFCVAFYCIMKKWMRSIHELFCSSLPLNSPKNTFVFHSKVPIFSLSAVESTDVWLWLILHY